MSTARSSDYSWDSMKISVDPQVPREENCRLIMNLCKTDSPTSETIQGKIHRCREHVCSHNTPQDIIGDLTMTILFDKKLKDYQREGGNQIKSEPPDQLTEGVGRSDNELSDEVFYPSWYDHLRMNGLSQIDTMFNADRENAGNSSIYLVNHLNLHTYASDRDHFLSSDRGYGNDLECTEVDETYRFREVRDRGENGSDPRPEIMERQASVPLPEIKKKIRQLKRRLMPSEFSSDDPDVSSDDTDDKRGRQVDRPCKNYGFHNEDPSDLSGGQADERNGTRDDGSPLLRKRHSGKIDRGLQENFLRNPPADLSHLGSDSDTEELVIFLDSSSVNNVHRSFSASVLTGFPETHCASKCNTEKERDETKRPKSGPERKSSEYSSASELNDWKKYLVESDVRKNFSQKIDEREIEKRPDTPKKKKERWKLPGTKKKENCAHLPGEKSVDDCKNTKTQGTDGRCRELAADKPLKNKSDRISSDSVEESIIKEKSRRNGDKRDGAQPSAKADREDRTTDISVASGRNKSKEERKIKKSNKDIAGNGRTKTITRLHKKTDCDDTGDVQQPHTRKENGSDPGKSKKKELASTKGEANGTCEQEKAPADEASRTSPPVDDGLAVSKRALSFLELISVITDEVKHLARKKEKRKIREKIN